MLKFIVTMITISKEDYLKEIYALSLFTDEPVSTSKIAEKLNITNAATSDMAKKLSALDLLSYEKYKGVKLTEKGRTIALNTIRRHRLWETFLIKTLGLNWGEVHDEAEVLEHQTSEFLMDRIDQFLNFPEFDPHGDPIPTKEGLMPVLPEVVCLTEAEIGKTYIIQKVDHDNKEVMDYFTKLGIELYSEIALEDRMKFDNSVFVSINNIRHTFSQQVASKLFVVNKNI
ncbi:MAG: metal-dependent transcriptional regulator [Bacteroidetes bacterium]|nr:metal-dependent transcriptional regulator [Bacteroidota bacterium]